MRTTVNIDEDILRLARQISSETGAPLGTVLSDLARKGLTVDRIVKRGKKTPTFEVSESAPVFSTEDVRRAEDEV